MIAVRHTSALALLVLTAATCAPAVAADAAKRTVVVLLFDGFAPSMVEGNPVPHLDRLRAEGAWTHHMVPAFPSVSLINQTTISTGCWPEHHGIVTNVFLDPQQGEYDHSHDADWLKGCEHLHQTAERQGVRAASLGWVGRYSGTRGDLATYTSAERDFAEFPTDAQRAEQVIRMLNVHESVRPQLILAYFRGPDGPAHFEGMEAAKTQQAVRQSDALIGRVVAAIEALPFRDQVTLLVTTDHGMVPVTYNVNVQRILANHGITARVRSSGTTSFLYFDDAAQIDRALAELSGYAQFDAVRKDAQPPDWHLGAGARVGDVILSAKPPYFIEDVSRWPGWVRWLGAWGPEFLWAGWALQATHGYPPGTPGVDGILYAWGAGIPPGRELPEVRAVDVHPTVARLLGISPGKPVDGAVARELLTR